MESSDVLSASAHSAHPPSITVERVPACSRFRITDFLDTKQRFLVYNVAHYESHPRVPRGVEDANPSARFLGCYATRDSIVVRAQALMEGTDGFALRVTPTFQFDVLCADQTLSNAERRSRILRVLRSLRAKKERDAAELQERATRAHLERLASTTTSASATAAAAAAAVATTESTAPPTAVRGGRAQKLTVKLQEYNWDMLEALAPSEDSELLRHDAASTRAGEGSTESESAGAGAGADAAAATEPAAPPSIMSLDDCEVPLMHRRVAQTHLLVAMLEDELHPFEPVFIAFKAGDNESVIERWMRDIAELLAPLSVLSVPLYEFGPLTGFDNTLTLEDHEYERSMNAHRPGLLAASEEELRDRIRREFRLDPDGAHAMWIRPGEEVKPHARRVFEMRSVTVKTLDAQGNVTNVEQLPSSSWRYLDDAEMTNLPRNVADVRAMAEGRLGSLTEAMTSRSHSAATSLIAGRDVALAPDVGAAAAAAAPAPAAAAPAAGTKGPMRVNGESAASAERRQRHEARATAVSTSANAQALPDTERVQSWMVDPSSDDDA